MRRIVTLLALAGTVATNPAFAATWRLAANGGTAPTRSIFYVDTDSIRRNGDDLTVVTLSFFESTTDSRSFDKSIITRKANCAQMTSQITRGEFYLKGKLLEISNDPGNMITHQPNTVMYGTLSSICGKRAYLGPAESVPTPIWSSAAPVPAPYRSSGGH